MTEKRPYREQIDACRPGSDDLSLPGLAELAQAVESDRAVGAEFQRSQRFDQAVAAAMHDVPVPDGLLQRLLDRVAQPLDQALASEAPAAEAVQLPPPSADQPAGKGRSSRRRWLQLAVGFAAAASIGGLAVWQARRPLPTVTPDELAARASDWMGQVAPDAGWSPVTVMPPHFPDRALLARPVAQKPLRTAEGWSGTAYRCTAGGSNLTLFVFPTPRANVRVAAAPYTPLQASMGRSMAAWQTGGVLYVVVLEDQRLRLEDVIRTPRTV